MNVRIEYDAVPIRHIAVQCPRCGRWYAGRDITEQKLNFSNELYHAQFICPVCGHVFGANECQGYSNVKITECVGHEEVYKDCLHRKEVWVRE